MSKTPPVSFRMPHKYVVFLDSLIGSEGRSRAHVLNKIIDSALTYYLATGELPRVTTRSNQTPQRQRRY